MVGFGQSCISPCQNLGPHLQNLRNKFTGPINGGSELYRRSEADRIDLKAQARKPTDKDQEAMAQEFERLENQGRQAIANLQNLKVRVADGVEVLRQLKAAQARLNGVVDDITLLVEDAKALSDPLPDTTDLQVKYGVVVEASAQEPAYGNFLQKLLERSVQFFRDAAQAPTVTQVEAPNRSVSRRSAPSHTSAPPPPIPQAATPIRSEPQSPPPCDDPDPIPQTPSPEIKVHEKKSETPSSRISAQASEPETPRTPIRTVDISIKQVQPSVQEVPAASSVSRITTGPADSQCSRATTPMGSSFSLMPQQIAARAGAACGIFTSKSFEDKRPSVKQHKRTVQKLLLYIYSHVPVLTSIHLFVGPCSKNSGLGSIVYVEEVILYRDNSMRKFLKDLPVSSGKRHAACVVYQETQNIDNSFVVSEGHPEINITESPQASFYGFLVSNYIIIYRAYDEDVVFNREKSEVYFDLRVLSSLKSHLDPELKSCFIEFSGEDNYRYSLCSAPQPKTNPLGVTEPTSAALQTPSTTSAGSQYRDSRFAYCRQKSKTFTVEATGTAAGKESLKEGKGSLKPNVTQGDIDDDDTPRQADEMKRIGDEWSSLMDGDDLTL